MRVKVTTYPREEIDREVELQDGAAAMDLFEMLDLRLDSWIVVREDCIIPDDAPLRDGDRLRLLSVVSGG